MEIRFKKGIYPEETISKTVQAIHSYAVRPDSESEGCRVVETDDDEPIRGLEFANYALQLIAVRDSKHAS